MNTLNVNKNSEEVEKLKTEIRDLKQIVNLRKDIKYMGMYVENKSERLRKNGISVDNSSENGCESNVTGDTINLWKKFSRRQPNKSTPKRRVAEETEEFTCKGYNKAQLTKHIS